MLRNLKPLIDKFKDKITKKKKEKRKGKKKEMVWRYGVNLLVGEKKSFTDGRTTNYNGHLRPRHVVTQSSRAKNIS